MLSAYIVLHFIYTVNLSLVVTVSHPKDPVPLTRNDLLGLLVLDRIFSSRMAKSSHDQARSHHEITEASSRSDTRHVKNSQDV